MAASGEALHIGGGTVIPSSRSRETEDPADPRGITAMICALQVSRVVRGKITFRIAVIQRTSNRSRFSIRFTISDI